MNFRKLSKGEGGGIIFNLKNYIANFRNFKQGFLSMKLIQKGCFRQKYHNFSFKKVSMILDIENSILETFPYCENVQDLGFREYRRSIFSGLFRKKLSDKIRGEMLDQGCHLNIPLVKNRLAFSVSSGLIQIQF